MKTLLFSFFWGCQDQKDTLDEPPIEDTQITDTSDNIDTNDPIDTGDTVDTAIVDTGDTQDTSETAETGDTTDTTETGEPVDTGRPPNPVMDFSKVNVNPNSTSFGVSASPRDYMQQISGWYFIKAT